jgi:peroxiredoxin
MLLAGRARVIGMEVQMPTKLRRKFGVFFLIFCLGMVASMPAQKIATDFTLPSATDNSLIRLSNHGGNVILINWWRSKCNYSKREAPKLLDLYSKYHDRGLEIIGISDDTIDSVGNVQEYIKSFGITWPVGLNDQGEFMRDVRPMGSGSTPENYLVSRSGEITYLGRDRTAESWSKLEEAVEAALAKDRPDQNPISPSPLEDAPGFILSDLSGKKFDLKSFHGRPLIVNFFFSGTCDWTGDILQKLYDYYLSKGLQVVGINLYDKDGDIKKCMDKFTIEYPILKADQKTQQDWIGSRGGWGVFFITPDGKILKKIVNKINNGIEPAVFPKIVEYMLKNLE